MTREELILDCRYYNGEETYPEGVDSLMLGYEEAWVRMVLENNPTPQECIDCEVASGCAWCQGENYDAADTPTIYQRATAICKMHKARVRANNYYWNKLYRKLELEGLREEYEKNKREVKPEIC